MNNEMNSELKKPEIRKFENRIILLEDMKMESFPSIRIESRKKSDAMDPHPLKSFVMGPRARQIPVAPITYESRM